jgi:hypothetical protein
LTNWGLPNGSGCHCKSQLHFEIREGRLIIGSVGRKQFHKIHLHIGDRVTVTVALRANPLPECTNTVQDDPGMSCGCRNAHGEQHPTSAFAPDQYSSVQHSVDKDPLIQGPEYHHHISLTLRKYVAFGAQRATAAALLQM